jgi:hypothetical protein
MNESAFAGEFREVLKALEPGAVVFRHVEQFSRDVPDTSITLNDRTLWIEFKRAWKEDPENFDYPQEKTHTKMGNVWVVNFVVDLAGRLYAVMIYHPARPFPSVLTVSTGRKGRNEAYRATWGEIRPAFFSELL